MNDRTPDECYRDELTQVVRCSDDDLMLLMMRTSDPRTVGRNGIQLFGRHYHSPELFGLLGKKVYARFDPEQLGRLHVFDLDDRYVCTCERKDLMKWGASREDLQAAMRAKAHHRKIAASYRESCEIVTGDPLENIARQRKAAAAERADRGGETPPPDGGMPQVMPFHTVFADAARSIAERRVAAGGEGGHAAARAIVAQMRQQAVPAAEPAAETEDDIFDYVDLTPAG